MEGYGQLGKVIFNVSLSQAARKQAFSSPVLASLLFRANLQCSLLFALHRNQGYAKCIQIVGFNALEQGDNLVRKNTG